MAVFSVLLLLALPALPSAQRYPPELLRSLSEKYRGLSGDSRRTQEFAVLLERALEDAKTDRRVQNISGSLTEPLVPFNCHAESRSPSRPTSVHKLFPGDIDVVAALGDSITAGFGAKASNILGIMTEYRGVSWSVGGDETVESRITVPNILKFYNPDVIGFSVGTGDATSTDAHFNAAVSGAVASDMPAQAVGLSARLREQLSEDMWQNGWKLVTMFIGGNDLCAWCDDKATYGAAAYKTHVLESLRHVQQTVPRVFLSIVPTIDVTQLHDMDGVMCSLMHAYECPCSTKDEATRAAVRAESNAFQEMAHEIAAALNANASDTFVAVVQPFMSNTTIPQDDNGQPDTSYFAPDCFHFSGKGHQAAAIMLWNNMLEAVGEKEDRFHGPAEQILCPAAGIGYLRTAQNSAP
eukprot:TRINITY_DN55719_c0_g1_i1.p1 TRINITY_DN55719_c0_g1~~TRINITY_DN55719_c0_g1_i1.p1  ORF type:complete len:430 (-),score=70.54 TRINITY_DN55719_c0_g1_i1:364-1593(-)